MDKDFCSFVLKITPPLDQNFVPPSVFNKQYRNHLKENSDAVIFIIALERENGMITRRDLSILSSDVTNNTWLYLERIIKFLLWSSGGKKLYISGPELICQKIKECYSSNGSQKFDNDLMSKVYDTSFEIVITDSDKIPKSFENGPAIGGNISGNRIGFDLGASDYKISAVSNGQVVFSTELPWNPVVESDPNYHIEKIREGLKLAASHLPTVDAIGGSSAGIIVDCSFKIASLFRSVSKNDFNQKIKPFFKNLGKEWNVPFVIINDGDVTALAGSMSMSANGGILGIAMGSSEAAGFVDSNGKITGRLNELAFAPHDYNSKAPADEWSGDLGVGALYFSQQAVNRLALAAGISFPEDSGLPERLKVIQHMAQMENILALEIFETIGIYLGYTIPYYLEFYQFENLLILGRVTSGRGGEIILEKAREVLAEEFPDVASSITLKIPEERERRVGQAVAAASLPEM